MKIAIYQCEGKPARTEDNLEILRQSAREAAGQEAQLLICSEMFLTGYNIGDKVFELAETANGPSKQKAAEIAREENIALLYGYPERIGTVVSNSAILIDHNGTMLANYRKTHLYGQQENFNESKRYFTNALMLLKDYKQAEVLPESDGLTAGRLSEIIASMINGDKEI